MKPPLGRLARTVASLLAVLLAACGSEQKAAVCLALDGFGQHPEVHETYARLLAAETLAAMDLSPEQVTALRAWSEHEGRAVRADLDGRLRLHLGFFRKP